MFKYFIKFLAHRKAKQIKKELEKDPEYRQLQEEIEENKKQIMAKAEKERKTNPELDKALKKAGI
tara:strand:+ start:549 stop:743 length:195 start_codon:yes stop_codon:yes gene_type:complete